MSHGRFESRVPRAPAPPLSDAASLPEIADRLGIDGGVLAAWAEAGLIRTHTGTDTSTDGLMDGPTEVDVADASLLRSLCDADRPGLTPSALRRTLDHLRDRQPTSAGPMREATIVVDPAADVRDGDGCQSDSRRGDDVAGYIGRDGGTSAGDWHATGIDQERAGDPAAAARSYEQALRAGGADPQIVFDLAYALAACGETVRAAERYRQVTEMDPGRADAWVNLGDLLLTTGDTAAAINAFRHALDLDPDDAAAHYDLAEAFDLADDGRRAALHWAAFVRLTDAPSEQWRYARHRLATASLVGHG